MRGGYCEQQRWERKFSRRRFLLLAGNCDLAPRETQMRRKLRIYVVYVPTATQSANHSAVANLINAASAKRHNSRGFLEVI